MKIIFCISNLFVPTTLTLINKNKNDFFLIYVDQKGLFDFFKVLNLDKVILYYCKDIKPLKKVSSIIKYIKHRNAIFKHLQKYKFSEIYFFHNTFGNLENWLIIKLSTNSVVNHCPILNSLSFKAKFSVIAKIRIISTYLIFKTNVKPLWTGERYIYQMTNSFFKKINSKLIRVEVDQNYIKKLIDTKFNLSFNKTIVLLTGSIVELGQVERQEYISKVDNLIKYIGNEYILAKPHPRYPSRFSLEDKLGIIPSYIPANVLFSRFNVFIGYSTTLISEAANAGLISISLLDYLDPVIEDRKINYKDYLLTSTINKNIFFPKNIGEINSILNHKSKLQ